MFGRRAPRDIVLTVVVLVAASSLAACTGGDDPVTRPTRETTETSRAGTDPDDAMVPIETVAPTTAIPTPTTSEPPPRLPDRIANANPEWVPVDVATGDPLRPTSLRRLAEGPESPAYDVSPDGLHLALVTPTRGLCLRSTADASDEVCDDSIESNFVVWSPDSSKVLFNLYSSVLGRSGPLGTFAVDGTVTTVVEPSTNEALFDGVTAAGFVDADTVVYTHVVNEPARQLDVHSVSIDGGDDRLIGSLSLGSLGTGGDVFLPIAGLLDGATLYSNVTTRAVGGNGIWRYDADTDAFGRLVDDDPTGPAGLLAGSTPVAVRGGVLLFVESARFAAYTSHRDDARFFGLTTTDGARSASIDDIDPDYMILSAALSPDGAHVVVYEWYRGDDRAIGESAASGRVSIATTASIIDGRPIWFTETDVGPSLPSRNLDRTGTAVTWPTDDRVYVELTDAAYEIVVEPA
jgi:hypothetical protein